MARHKRDYIGEHLTAFLGVQIPPTMLTTLKTAVVTAGTTTSDLVREILSRHLGCCSTVAPSRHDPHARMLENALVSAANANSANGNLFNQIARHLHTTEELGPFAADLRDAIAINKRIAEMHKTALAKFTAA